MGGSKKGATHLASSEVNAFGVHFGELAVSMAQFTLSKKAVDLVLLAVM